MGSSSLCRMPRPREANADSWGKLSFLFKVLLTSLQPEKMFHNISYANRARGRRISGAGNITDGLAAPSPNMKSEKAPLATASFLEVFIDEAEKRCWFLFEASRQAERSCH